MTPFAEEFAYLFNSYYQSVGPQYRRAQRSMISRPTCEEVLRYRDYVDSAIKDLVNNLQGSNCCTYIRAAGIGLSS